MPARYAPRSRMGGRDFAREIDMKMKLIVFALMVLCGAAGAAEAPDTTDTVMAATITTIVTTTALIGRP